MDLLGRIALHVDMKSFFLVRNMRSLDPGLPW
jgi:hypothetical protein